MIHRGRHATNLHHIFDPAFQGDGTGGAATTTSLHLEPHDSVFKGDEFNITSVLLHRWPDPAIEKLLDHEYDFRVLFILVVWASAGLVGGHGGLLDDGQSRVVKVHDGGVDVRLDDGPLQVVHFVDGNEVRPKEATLDAGQGQDLPRQR